jgi:hypothetical protein
MRLDLWNPGASIVYLSYLLRLSPIYSNVRAIVVIVRCFCVCFLLARPPRPQIDACEDWTRKDNSDPVTVWREQWDLLTRPWTSRVLFELVGLHHGHCRARYTDKGSHQQL